MRLHLDGIVDGDVGEAAGEGGGLVQIVLGRGQEHDVVHGGERVAVRIAQSAVGRLPQGDELGIILHAERDVLALVHDVAGADLLAVEVDGDPLVVLVDDEVERLARELPAAGIAAQIAGKRGLGLFEGIGGLVRLVIVGWVIVVRDLDGHLALGRQEDDIVAVLDREIQLVDTGVVQDVVFVVVDEDVIGRGDLGFLVGAEIGADGLAVGERAVDKFGVPFGAGRGGDADGRDLASGAVDECDGDGHVLFAAAGQKQQAQDRSQQHKKQVPDFFHDDPPRLKLKKLHDKRSDTSLPWSDRVS